MYECPSGRLRPTRRSGFSLIELLVVIAIIGVLATIAAINLRDLDQPLHNARDQFAGTLRQARIRAISSTSAYFVQIPASGTQAISYTAQNCRVTDKTKWTEQRALQLKLPEGVKIATGNTTLTVCFTARGLAQAGQTFTLTDTKGRTAQVQLLLGGGIEVAQ
ncbi:type II secretion system protein H [Deinobacterium chartae]|uniref:Type II secretion system protein H n=1 Tax=Deinobacterium chartae TaxID=521158 RepID=A0A841I2H1_9DEIO|nr:GspH/FimT family pseudopilin [Deinobacterium chartae]MBB6098242.1 type II secretion system protein H [Deinobacterium chartae]